jgi:hypothetical protein
MKLSTKNVKNEVAQATERLRTAAYAFNLQLALRCRMQKLKRAAHQPTLKLTSAFNPGPTNAIEAQALTYNMHTVFSPELYQS